MLKELLKEDLLSAHLKYFKKAKRSFIITRVLYGVITTLFFLMGMMLLKNYLWLVASPAAFYFGWKYAYLNLLLNKKNLDVKNAFLFPQFLQSFMALLSSSGNVYQALKESIHYTSDPLKYELEKLVQKIEKGNNRVDYLVFAEYVGSSEAYMIMNMIYQFSEQGVEKESLRELELYIHNLQENKVDELIQSKMVAIEKYGMIPIFISLVLVGGFAGVIFMHYMSDVTNALNVIPN
ncbi:MAG: type II secretion system F family protein [Lysinibacillus sp.]